MKYPPMVCYYCGRQIDRYYWIPTPRAGIYAACCRECKEARLKGEGA